MTGRCSGRSGRYKPGPALLVKPSVFFLWVEKSYRDSSVPSGRESSRRRYQFKKPLAERLAVFFLWVEKSYCDSSAPSGRESSHRRYQLRPDVTRAIYRDLLCCDHNIFFVFGEGSINTGKLTGSSRITHAYYSP